MNKFYAWLTSMWKDSVWSKVISVGILALIGMFWVWYKNTTLREIYELGFQFLNFKIHIYFLFLLIGIYFIVAVSRRYFKKKKNSIYNEQIGNYKFKELCKILEGERLNYRNLNMEINGAHPPDISLLEQFYSFSSIINAGISIDSYHDTNGYLWGIFCPKMMQYGLVAKIYYTDSVTGQNEVKYQTSLIGYKFLSLQDKRIHKL